ncbi:MAG: type II secretion system F family protein [Planctomycetota bacterium]|nr:MAG: type II secretion system F family protein [Planctomycetota bacterium]
MPEFKYVARDEKGQKVYGTITADTLGDAKVELRRKNLVILSLEEKTAKAKKGVVGRKPRVRLRDLALFTRQLSTMISAGIPILESVEVLVEQVEDPGFKEVLRDIADAVRAGTDLSEAMSQHPEVFKDLYINMVRAGEASGQLDEILNRLAEYLEETDALRREIKSAMTYPAVSLTMIVGIVIVLLVFVIPRFEKIFVAIKRQAKSFELPLPTQILFKTSHFVRENTAIWVPALVGLVVVIVLATRGGRGSYLKDYILLKLPVMGPLIHKVALSRFARTFATLLQSGVPILATLDIVATTTGNKVLEKAIVEASQSIQEGEPLAVPLAKSGVFPTMVTRMVLIGERSGALETLLSKISDFYDTEVKATVKQLTSLIEPIMILLMGVVVGGVVMAVFLPIFKMAGAIGRH